MSKNTLPKKRYNAEERSAVELVRKNYQAALDSRQNSSYWADTDGDGSSDWLKRWDLQEKIAIGWSETPSADSFESNVKSPMSSGRIDSTMQKLKKLDLQFIVRPDNIKDYKEKRKARVVQELLNNLFQRRYYKARMNTWFQDTLIHGSGYLHIYYLQKKRKVRMADVNTKEMSEEQKESIKAGKKVYKEETIYDYNDIAFEPVKRQEIFEDPQARNLHDTSYEAQWIIRRMLPSLDQFKAMYSSDPDAENVSKVRPTSAYVGEEVEFFKPPADVTDNNTVEVLHFYDKANDKYIVIANDVKIKETPLPYNHKQLPFVKIDCYEVLHQMQGMGIPDRLKNIQGEEEILKNLIYDRLHITANPMLKVKESVYGEFSKAYQTSEPGLMLPVKQQDDVMPLEYPAMSFDMFRGIEALDRDAVVATQIDPTQMGVSQKYVSATTSMLTKEQMDGFITSLIETWTEALTIAAKECISLMSQFYTVPRVEAAGKTAKGKQMRLTDIEIDPNTLQVTEKRGKYSYLEIKPEFFNINGDWDIEIAPESIEVQSRAIEMQKSQAALAQLAPFMIDPSNPQSAMSNPQGWIDGPKSIKWYLETNGIPQELLAVTTEDDDVSIERAEEQIKRILNGEQVAGIPGENEIHKQVQAKQLSVINAKRKELGKKLDAYGPEMMSMLQGSPEMEELTKLDTIAQDIADHMIEDDKPAAMESMSAIEKAQPPAPVEPPQVPMPPGLNQGGAGQPPMPIPAGGNQASGMGSELPQQGRPPMAAM